MLVVDASAVLAFILGEPGGDVLAGCDEDLSMSCVNLAEVLTRVEDRGLAIEDALEVVRALGIEPYLYDREAAIRSARLRALTRRFGLSLGDRCCLALAERLSAPVLTGDRRWVELDLALDIRLIR